MKHLQKIDFLRGLAIILVFIYHAQLVFFPGYEVSDYNKNGILNIHDFKSLILNFSPSAYGWTGVELFLIISGFLIHLGFLKNQKKFKIITFYSKRFWRIYPPYLLTLFFFSFATGGLGYFFISKTTVSNFFLHVFAVHNIFENSFFSINPSLWSLALEIQLYIIYPVLLYLRKIFNMKKAFIIILLFSFVLSILGLIFKNFGSDLSYSTSVFKLWFVWAAGAFYAELYFNQKIIVKNYGALIAITSFLFMIVLKYFIYSSYLVNYVATFAYIIFMDWFLNSNFININNRLSKSIIAIGLCSYSLYLIHQPYMNNLVNFFTIFSKKHSYLMILNIIPVFIVLYFISYSLYKLIELPSIEIGNNIRSKNTMQ